MSLVRWYENVPNVNKNLLCSDREQEDSISIAFFFNKTFFGNWNHQNFDVFQLQKFFLNRPENCFISILIYIHQSILCFLTIFFFSICIFCEIFRSPTGTFIWSLKFNKKNQTNWVLYQDQRIDLQIGLRISISRSNVWSSDVTSSNIRYAISISR